MENTMAGQLNLSKLNDSEEHRQVRAGDLGWFILWLLWQCVRVPALLLLVTLEPVVTFVLSALALMGVLAAFFWELVGPPHFHFPFFLVLGISLGFALARFLYYALLSLLSAN
jgi:hypothetical protein